MDTNVPLQPITPQDVPNARPQPPARPLTNAQVSPWIVAVIVILVGIIVLLLIRQMQATPSTPVTPSPTPTATPTPTPVRTASPFATSSAFMSLDTMVASFSAAVKSYNSSDPSLAPPAIDLPLGF